MHVSSILSDLVDHFPLFICRLLATRVSSERKSHYFLVSTSIADLDAAAFVAFLAALIASRFLASEIFKVSGKSFSSTHATQISPTFRIQFHFGEFRNISYITSFSQTSSDIIWKKGLRFCDRESNQKQWLKKTKS